MESWSIKTGVMEFKDYILSYAPFGTYLLKKRHAERYGKWDLVLDLEKTAMLTVGVLDNILGTPYVPPKLVLEVASIYNLVAAMPSLYGTFLRNHKSYEESIESLENKLASYGEGTDEKISIPDKAKVFFHRILARPELWAIPISAMTANILYVNPFFDFYNSEMPPYLMALFDSFSHGLAGGTLSNVARGIVEEIPVEKHTKDFQRLEMVKRHISAINMVAVTLFGTTTALVSQNTIHKALAAAHGAKSVMNFREVAIDTLYYLFGVTFECLMNKMRSKKDRINSHSLTDSKPAAHYNFE